MSGSADGLRVGILDASAPTAATERVVAAVESAGGTATIADDEPTTEVSLLVTVGEPALQALVRSEYPDVPVLPVDADSGIESVPIGDVESAIDEIVDEQHHERVHSVLSVSVDGDEWRALRDVALVTDEPARISEFGVEATGFGQVAAFRADGVTIATPAGSYGYAAAADGPLLAPETGLSIVPIAPFVTDADHWILPTDGVSCTVRRDDATIAVVIDGERRTTATMGSPVRCQSTDDLRVIVVPSSRSLFRS